MAIPFFKEMRIGGYLIKQKLLGRKRYPLVLMLEPLFRCNLACVGCGKIDYPDAILNRTKTKKLFRDVFALGKGKKWNFMHSGLFLDFLAGNQEYECTPWGMPARNIFGWQKPCYLLGEGYAKTFKELMDTTDWETYGTGKYEKCADCMAHCGYEPTAATAAINNPLKAMWVALRGIKTTGPMAPEIDMSKQRPAQYIFSQQVQKKLSEIRRDEAIAAEQKKAAAAQKASTAA